MAASNGRSTKLPVAAEADVLQAKLSLLLGRSKPILSTSLTSSVAPPPKSMAEVLSDKAELFLPRNQEGLLIQQANLDGKKVEARNNVLLQQITGKKDSRAISRERTIKQSPYQRSMLAEESEEEEGRSGLGKVKISRAPSTKMLKPAIHPAAQQQSQHSISDIAASTTLSTSSGTQEHSEEVTATAGIRSRDAGQEALIRHQKRPRGAGDRDDLSSCSDTTKVRKLDTTSSEGMVNDSGEATTSPAESVPVPGSVTRRSTSLSSSELPALHVSLSGNDGVSTCDASDTNTIAPHSILLPSAAISISTSASAVASKLDRKKEKKRLAKKARKERDRLLRNASSS